MFGINPFIIITVWVILTLFVTAIGSQRQIGGVISFFISFFFSPFIGVIVVYLTPSNEDTERMESIRLYLDNLNFMYAKENGYETDEIEGESPA